MAMLCYAKSLQSCPTLCDPIDGSPPGSAVPGILQARTLEWVAISFSNAGKRKVKVKSLSRVQLFATPWTAAYQAPLSMDFPGKSTGVGCHCLLWKMAIHTINWGRKAYYLKNKYDLFTFIINYNSIFKFNIILVKSYRVSILKLSFMEKMKKSKDIKKFRYNTGNEVSIL